MQDLPLVSVICTCFNHEPYVVDSLSSVERQSYKNIELIIVNNGSTDNSSNQIKKWIGKRDFIFLDLTESITMTKAFNLGLEKAHGRYIVDLSTDDILTQDSIDQRLNMFIDSKFSNLGVVFCNVEKVDFDGNHVSYLYEIDEKRKAIKPPPQGDIYKALVHSYFISATSMLIKKEVFDELNGYDEELDYEDFDFWVRSSRNYQYAYVDEILVKKRILVNSLSSNFKNFKGKNLGSSTLRVCYKAYYLNQNLEEDLALVNRIQYHAKWAIKNYRPDLFFKYLKLLVKLKARINRR